VTMKDGIIALDQMSGASAGAVRREPAPAAEAVGEEQEAGPYLRLAAG
jgi:hypothetical protein